MAQYFRRPCTYSRVVPGAGCCESESVSGFLSGAGVVLCNYDRGDAVRVAGCGVNTDTDVGPAQLQ